MSDRLPSRSSSQPDGERRADGIPSGCTWETIRKSSCSRRKRSASSSRGFRHSIADGRHLDVVLLPVELLQQLFDAAAVFDAECRT